MPISVTIESDTIEGIQKWLKERPKEMEEQLNRAIQFSITDVERETKINAPVKTGLLRSSIHKVERKLEGEVYAGVTYAVHQEYGTRYFKGRFFMTNAVKNLTQKINEYFRKALERVSQ